jgi:hypothetical protein
VHVPAPAGAISDSCVADLDIARRGRRPPQEHRLFRLLRPVSPGYPGA